MERRESVKKCSPRAAFFNGGESRNLGTVDRGLEKLSGTPKIQKNCRNYSQPKVAGGLFVASK